MDMRRKKDQKNNNETNNNNNNTGGGIGFVGVLMPLLIPLMIVVLLASFIMAIFNGIIEIVQTVLGEIMDFLNDPVGWISDKTRHVYNTFTIAFRWKRCNPRTAQGRKMCILF